ncbi:hypothetical protein EBT31_07615 [bacterium]|nr:hypothetical protein [bacterium]
MNLIQFVNPPFTQLKVREGSYNTQSFESGVDVFNPRDSNPLTPGEFLEYYDGETFQRGGNGALASSPTPDGEGTKPAFLNHMEIGRVDVQAAKVASVINDTAYIIKTKVFSSAGSLAKGDKVSVWDIPYDGRVVRGLAKYNSGYVIGTVIDIDSTWLTVRVSG